MEFMMLEWLVGGFHGTPMTHAVGLVHHLGLGLAYTGLGP